MGLRRLDPASAWPLSRGAGVTVAVIDSGVSAIHPLLKEQVLKGRDFNGLPANEGQCDLAGHGTMVAGIIAGKDGTGSPFSGIAPAARILPIRVLPDAKGTNDEALPGQIAAAIDFAVDNGADVINLSLVTLPRPELARAVERALAKRVVLVAAAGNRQENQEDRPAYPAAYPGVIAVGGVDEQGGHVGTSVSGDLRRHGRAGLNIVGPAPGGAGYRASRRAAPASPPRTSRGWPRWSGPPTRTSPRTRSPTGWNGRRTIRRRGATRRSATAWSTPTGRSPACWAPGRTRRSTPFRHPPRRPTR